MKLIRVHEGIYRNESASVRVFKRSWVNKETPWVVVYENLFGSTVQKWYRTLKEAKESLR